MGRVFVVPFFHSDFRQILHQSICNSKKFWRCLFRSIFCGFSFCAGYFGALFLKNSNHFGGISYTINQKNILAHLGKKSPLAKKISEYPKPSAPNAARDAQLARLPRLARRLTVNLIAKVQWTLHMQQKCSVQNCRGIPLNWLVSRDPGPIS